MTATENAAIERRWIEAYNERNTADEEGMRSADYVAHTPGFPPFDNASWKQFIWGFSTSFPDLHLTIEETVSDEDKVAARIQFRGTHRGEFMGIPPTGKQVSFSSMEMNRIVDGKIAEHWFIADMLGLMQQLGAVPTPA